MRDEEKGKGAGEEREEIPYFHVPFHRVVMKLR